MKIEWLVADETAVGFPDRAEREVLRMIFQAAVVVWEPLCDF